MNRYKQFKKYFEALGPNAQSQKIAYINTAVFFLVWLAISLFIADTPPPPGFIFIILILIILSFVLYIYCKSFIPRIIFGEKHVLWKTLLHWVMAGAIVGFLFCLLPGGEPSMQGLVTIYDKLILFGVMVFLSVISGIGLYVFNIIFIKILKK